MVADLALEPYFQRWKEIHDRTDDQLAAYLGLAATKLAPLAAERVHPELEPRQSNFEHLGQPGLPILDIFALDLTAERYGADITRLVKVVLSTM